MNTIYTILVVVFFYWLIIFSIPSDKKPKKEKKMMTTASKAHHALLLIGKERPEDLHKFLMFDSRLLGQIINYKKTKTDLEILYKFPDDSGIEFKQSLQGHGYRTYKPILKLNKKES